MSSVRSAAPQDGDFDHLRNEFECPVCLEIRKGPIFQCEDGGHIICSKCHSGLLIKTCPVCKGAYATPPSRNMVIERMIDRLNLPENCFNYKDGCRFSSRQDAVKMHEQDCLYRMVPCPHPACDTQVMLHQLEGHVTSDHNAKKVECSSRGIIAVKWLAKVSKGHMTWKLTMVTFNGQLFFPVLFQRANLYYAWIKKTTSGQSEVKVSLEGQKGTVALTGTTFNIETTTAKILRKPEKLLTFHKKQAKQCMTIDASGQEVIIVTFKLIDLLDLPITSPGFTLNKTTTGHAGGM
jgi:hypothetical protein